MYYWLEYDTFLFVLYLLLGLMFLEHFIISETCINYGKKIRFRISHIFRKGNVCANKLANLDFIHIEYFY